MSPSAAHIHHRGHARIDARSLAMHRAIAAKLTAKPALLAIAHDNLKRWTASTGPSKPYLEAWDELLAKPIEELVALIQEDGGFMRAMRQTSPVRGRFESAGTVGDL